MDVMRACLGENAGAVKTELDLVDRQIVRIQAMVGKLLQFARPSEFAAIDAPVELDALIKDCVTLVDHLLRESKITVSLDLKPGILVSADPGEMQQVVVNLIVNAMQAMGDSGALKLVLTEETQDATPGAALFVSDTGPGIAANKLDSVFDPFFTTKQTEGTGLGLSISQTLVQRVGGQITARNRPGGGAEFKVWLPAATHQPTL